MTEQLNAYELVNFIKNNIEGVVNDEILTGWAKELADAVMDDEEITETASWVLAQLVELNYNAVLRWESGFNTTHNKTMYYRTHRLLYNFVERYPSITYDVSEKTTKQLNYVFNTDIRQDTCSEKPIAANDSRSLEELFNGHTDFIDKLAGLSLDEIVANIKKWAQFKHKDGKFICKNPARCNKSAYARALREAGLTNKTVDWISRKFKRAN